MSTDERKANGAPAPLSLRANVLWNTLGCLFYQGCQWLTTIVVVTLSGNYENAGLLAIAMAIGNIFLPIALYKMRTFQVSDADGTHAQSEYSAMRFVTIALAFGICLPYTFLTTQGADTVLVVIAFLLFKTDESFVDFLYGVDQRGMRMDYIGRSQILRGVLSFTAFCTLLQLTHTLLWAVAGMFALCACVTLFYDIPHAKRFAELRPRATKKAIGMLLAECLPAVLAAVSNNAVVSVARQLLGNIGGDEMLGIYASIATPAVLVQAAVGYLYSPMIGGLSETWAHDSRADIARAVAKMALFTLGAVAVCCVVLLLVAPALLPLVFGSSISEHLFIFPFVLLCTVAIALTWLITDILIVFRKTWGAFVANGIALIVSATTSAWFIDAFELNGINFSIVLAYAACAIVGGVLIGRAIVKRPYAKSAD